MKSAILLTALASLLSFQAAGFAQSCSSGGGPQHQLPEFPSGPFSGLEPVGPPPGQLPARGPGETPPRTAAPAAPAARITVVDDAATSQPLVSNQAPRARITILPDGPAEPGVKEWILAGITDSASAAGTVEPKVVEPQKTTIPEPIKGLVGKWLSVARHGDGQLDTVELRLDESGLAELTARSAEGRRETLKRHIELKENELRLVGPDGEQSLGKLLEHNDRQFVLTRGGDQITFVRQPSNEAAPAQATVGATLLSALLSANR